MGNREIFASGNSPFLWPQSFATVAWLYPLPEIADLSHQTDFSGVLLPVARLGFRTLWLWMVQFLGTTGLSRQLTDSSPSDRVACVAVIVVGQNTMHSALWDMMRCCLRRPKPRLNRRRRSLFGKAPRNNTAEILEERALLSAGQLDVTFGDAGVVVTNVGETRASFYASDMAVQPDGRMVVIGTATPQSYADENYDIVVGRMNVNGVYSGSNLLDFSFGEGGMVRLNAGLHYDGAGAVAVLPGGQILVAGSSQPDFDDSKPAVTSVWRLKSNGNLDQSFGGGDGVVHFTNGPLFVTDIVVQSTGRIVVVGTDDQSYGEDFELVGFTPDGRIDSSFGINGHTVSDIGTGEEGVTTRDLPASAVVLDDDRILVMGTSLRVNTMASIARYTSNGVLDTGFSDDGKIRLDKTRSAAFDVHVLPDGNYLFGGAEAARPAFFQITAGGELDLSFGTNGLEKYVPPSSQTVRYGAIHRFDVRADGTIQAFVSSTLGNGSSDPFQFASRLYLWDYARAALLQVDSNFQPDSVVNSNGWSYVRNNSTNGSPAIEWLDDGRIVFAGSEGDVYRYLPDLQEDSSLTYAGYSFFNGLTLPSRDEAYAVTVADDGSIVVGGRTRGVSGLGSPYGADNQGAGGALALKFTANGSLDTSYDGYALAYYYSPDGNGRITYGASDNHRVEEGGRLTDIIVGDDGHLIGPVVLDDGKVFSTLTFNGYGQVAQINESFDSTDTMGSSSSPTTGGQIKSLGDGRYVMVGSVGGKSFAVTLGPDPKLSESQSPSQLYSEVTWTGPASAYIAVDVFADGRIAALTDDGRLVVSNQHGVADATFGVDGVFTIPDADAITVVDFTLLPDGKFLFGGTIQDAETSHFVVSKFNADGSVDPSFGANGQTVTAFPEATQLSSLVVQADGQIVVFGTVGNAVSIARYNMDGTADVSFGNHGTPWDSDNNRGG